jgi:hypothetical protein
MRRFLDDPLAWFVVGAFVGLLFGIARGSDWIYWVFWALGGFLVALNAFSVYLDNQPYETGIFTDARPPAVRAYVRSRFGRATWVPCIDQPHELAYWRRLHPNVAIVILLGLLGVIPAIVYVVWALRRSQTIVIRTRPDIDGTEADVLVLPRAHNGQRIANRLVRDLLFLGETEVA